MKTILSLWTVVLFSLSTFAQSSNYQITGTITDDKDLPLIGATIYISGSDKGTSTDFTGQYILQGLKSGEYTLMIEFLGFETDSIQISITDQNLEQNFQLGSTNVSIANVEVTADRITERTTVSNIAFKKADLEISQGLNEDPIRTMSTLPGVSSAGDLFSPSQIYVRGGAPEENLFLLDNNQIFFPWYFGGQKSVFNTETIEDIELLTGGFPVTYGNHMSSVLNVSTRDGSFTDYKGNISVGFYNASALFEGPIVKEKVSMLVATRRTYLDLFIKNPAFPVPSLTDFTYKFSYRINDKHKLSLSGLSSMERMDFQNSDPASTLPNHLITKGSNHFQSLTWKGQFGSTIYNKLSVTNSINKNNSDIGENLYIDINAWQIGFRNDFTWTPTNQHKVKAGLNWQYSTFQYQGTTALNPQEVDPNDTTIVLRDININTKGERVRGAYLLYDGNPIRRFGINVGLRMDQNPDGKYIDWSPRLALNFQVSKKSRIRASTGIFNQFPSTQSQNLRSNRAIHYILGFEHKFNSDWSGWIEAYWKDYQNLEYYDANLNYSNDGYGHARGVELFLRKKNGKLRGWLSYSFSGSDRKAPLLDTLQQFEYDQRHIFNIVLEYHIHKNPKLAFIPALVSANFRYADGRPYTPVIGAENQGAGWTPVRGAPFSSRYTDYHNLNLRIEWHFKITKAVRGKSFIEIFNIYNRKNPLGFSYQYGSNYPNNVQTQNLYTAPFTFGGGFRFEFGKE